jgi:glutamate racemase
MLKNPIGLFDSGVGGTSIFTAIHELLPNESMVYLADSANAPYGPKGTDWIIERSKRNTEFLLNQNCKLIVVACNTATTNAISVLRETYKVPFIGIEPAIKPASLKTKTKIIGVLATKGTLSSALFQEVSSNYKAEVKIIYQVGEGIVPLIESGKLNSMEMTLLLKSYLKPMIQANIDYLVLGCTHYPYLIPQLKQMLPEHIEIIASGEAVALQTKHILEKLNIENSSGDKAIQQFYTNGNIEVLKSLVSPLEGVYNTYS